MINNLAYKLPTSGPGGGGGGVATVTATLPIKSSGGANPNITTSTTFYEVGNAADWPYATIAAAIAQAVLDGETKAFIRVHENIVEDVTLPRGMTLCSASSTSQPQITITGNITNSIGDGTIGTVQGFILLRAGVGENITANAGTNLVLKNCAIVQMLDFPILSSSAGANVNFYDCVFVGTGLITAPCLDIGEGNINLDHCSTLTAASNLFADVTGGNLNTANNTIIVGSVLVSGTGELDFRDTLITTVSGPCVNLGAGTRCDFVDVQLSSTDLGANCLIGTGTLAYSNVIMTGTQTNYDPTIIFTPYLEIFENQEIYNIDGLIARGPINTFKGANVASANDLVLGSDGNVFTITGNVQINAIDTADWQAGSQVILIFSGAPTVKHNTVGGAGTAVILLAGSVDLVAAANTVLKLVYDGTQWQEVSRKVA